MAITNMIPQIWSARLLLALEKSLVFGQSGVINTDFEGDIRADGDRVHIHAFNDLTIGTYTKNSTTISYELLTDARQTLLIDQSKYFAFKVDDVDEAQMRPKIVDAATSRAGYQLAEVADRYLAGLYTGITNFTATSAATSANIYQKLVETAVKLDELNVPSAGRFAVVPPWVAGLLLQNATFLAASAASALNGAIGQVAGMSILVSNNVPTSGTAPVVSHIVAGHPMGWTFAQQIADVEGIRLEGSFADGVRGLHLYGAKVIQPVAPILWQASPGRGERVLVLPRSPQTGRRPSTDNTPGGW
jgi:N4-gp56 family major capsid protein